MYMFGYERGIFSAFRSFLDVTAVRSIVVIVGHCRSQCFHSIPYR
jgi:hypothetical protein